MKRRPEDWKIGDRVAIIPAISRHDDEQPVSLLVKTGYLKSKTLVRWVVELDHEHDGKHTMLAKESQLESI